MNRYLGSRSLLVLAVYSLVAGPLVAEPSFEDTVAPFLREHCVSCHGPEKQASRLRLDTVTKIDSGNRTLWTRVHEKVAKGEMPPKSRPRPDAGAQATFLDRIRQAQRAVGVAGSRRLNRRELGASLRHVTGLPINYESALPGDGTVAGFDTGADALQEASDSVEQWLRITRRAVDGIAFLEPSVGKVYSADLTATKDARRLLNDWKKVGAYGKVRGKTQLGVGLFIDPRAVGEKDELKFNVPVPKNRKGIVRLTLEVMATKPMDGLPNPRLWVGVGGKYIDYREFTTFDKPETVTYTVQFDDLPIEPRGLAVTLRNRVELPYSVPGFENEDKSNPKKKPIPGGTGLFRPRYDRKKLPPEKTPAPFVVLRKITIETDVVHQWPPSEWKADLPKIEDNADSADWLLTLWMERAWRRPVGEAEREPFRKLYASLRDKGMSFDEALRAAFQSVLLSAPFRYQNSPSHPDSKLAQYALASRLSFMLVGEPPDAELLRLAGESRLRDPKVLDAQVARLVADPRSRAFVEPFVEQWFEMGQPITIAQDYIEKQDFRFGRYLKESMHEETLAYVAELLRDNRPAKELIVSDWTMMNDSLARHYGYPGIEGGRLRKVTLRKDDPRGGGILGHSGLQSMLCWMGENWVIYRGAWAARHILDMPPPPPPLEVPELVPSEGKNKGKTFRELLVQHQEDVRCSVCHKNIDPIGFAFQNFDISGRWRDREHESYSRSELDGKVAWRGVGRTRPVDAAGQFPRGEKFRSFDEFKRVLVSEYQDDLVRGLLKNLFVYGTGHVPGIDAREEIEAILDSTREEGDRLRDVLQAVVRSKAFLGAPPNKRTIDDR